MKNRGFFSIGADATVFVSGRPVLDKDNQILRFADVALDVQSQAAFGLLGAAAQAAVPYPVSYTHLFVMVIFRH